MARKKKVEETTKETTNTISYKGEITLTVMHGKKKVKTIKTHNNGLLPLFEFLAHCLAGDFSARDVPNYIRLFDSSNVELTYNAIPQTSLISYTSTSTSATATLSFNVASGELRTLENAIKTFKIYSLKNMNDPTNPSATFTLDSGEEITISSGAILIVAWKMSVGNVQ